MNFKRNVIVTGLQLGEGCIWDQERGGKVNCYDHGTGAKIKEVLVPDPYVSCRGIGGAY